MLRKLRYSKKENIKKTANAMVTISFFYGTNIKSVCRKLVLFILIIIRVQFKRM